jgi:hypothetical protein
MSVVKHRYAGYGLSTALMAFALWMQMRRVATFPEDVMQQFEVSRATAHRWLNAYEEVTQIQRPRLDSHGRVRKIT